MLHWLRRLLGPRTEVKVDARLERLERRDRESRSQAAVAVRRAERILSPDGANRAQRVVRGEHGR